MEEDKGYNYNDFTVSYSDDVNSSDYITQFLNLGQIDNTEVIPNKRAINQQQVVVKREISTFQIENSHSHDQFQDGVKKATNYHNFQKHLVTTLRRLIDINKIKIRLSSDSLQWLLWDFLIYSTKLTKTLLYLIFGKSRQNNKTRKSSKKYGIQKILNKFPTSQIKKAQQNLRIQILMQAQKLNFQQQLQNRKIKNKEQFRVYFYAFIEQLKEGIFRKRIPKEKIIKIQHTNSTTNRKQKVLDVGKHN